jgi:integrase
MWRKVLEANSAANSGEYGLGKLLISRSARLRASMEERFAPFVDIELAAENLVVDEATRVMLLRQVGHAMSEAAEELGRYASGDYSPGAAQKRFPQLELMGGEPRGQRDRSGLGVRTLFEGWWTEAQAAGSAKPSTYQTYSSTIRRLIAKLGHDEAARVTGEDIVSFKDDRLAAGVSAKTVKDSDLVALKTIFGWAVRNRLLAENPATGISLKVGRKPKLRAASFTEEEAVSILRQSWEYSGGAREDRKLTAAKRWVPWLCAFTGARVGEMLQLRREDVREQNSLVILRVTPEAGTVKNNEAREVVLHDQLLELGFLQFVRSAPAGHLFVTPRRPDGDVLKPVKTARNRIGPFIRQVVPDRATQPSHAWRHRFKSVGMEQGISHRVLDAIRDTPLQLLARRTGKSR